MICNICFENISKDSITPWFCNHIFHRKCAKKHIKKTSKSTCPDCKSVIRPDYKKYQKWPPVLSTNTVKIRQPDGFVRWNYCRCNLDDIKWFHQSQHGSQIIGYCDRCRIFEQFDCPDLPVPPRSWVIKEKSCTVM